MNNKDLQVLYNYITNEIKDNEIKEFITELRAYVNNGSWYDYELTTDDYNDTCMNITSSHSLKSKDSINNLIDDLENMKEVF